MTSVVCDFCILKWELELWKSQDEFNNLFLSKFLIIVTEKKQTPEQKHYELWTIIKVIWSVCAIIFTQVEKCYRKKRIPHTNFVGRFKEILFEWILPAWVYCTVCGRNTSNIMVRN